MKTTSNLAITVAHLADEYGATIRWVVRQDDLLRNVHIDPAQLTEDVVGEAYHYFNALNDRSVRQAMLKWNGEVGVVLCGEEVQVETKSQPDCAAKRKMGKVVRAKIFGYSATAVLRWMGANDWTFEDAGLVMAGFGAGRISDVTIRLQLKAGKDGMRGPAAPVTASQVKKLKQMSE